MRHRSVDPPAPQPVRVRHLRTWHPEPRETARVADANVFNFGTGNDEVRCFLDADYSAVMAKVISAGVDPVELTVVEARRLADALMTLADRLEAEEAT
jgi:hypothetical protein